MTSTEKDEIMSPRPQLSKALVSNRTGTTMNTRAPTDLHDRSSATDLITGELLDTAVNTSTTLHEEEEDLMKGEPTQLINMQPEVEDIPMDEMPSKTFRRETNVDAIIPDDDLNKPGMAHTPRVTSRENRPWSRNTLGVSGGTGVGVGGRASPLEGNARVDEDEDDHDDGLDICGVPTTLRLKEENLEDEDLSLDSDEEGQVLNSNGNDLLGLDGIDASSPTPPPDASSPSIDILKRIRSHNSKSNSSIDSDSDDNNDMTDVKGTPSSLGQPPSLALSDRWAGQEEDISNEEKKAAHIRAVQQATERAAEERFRRIEEEEDRRSRLYEEEGIRVTDDGRLSLDPNNSLLEGRTRANVISTALSRARESVKNTIHKNKHPQDRNIDAGAEYRNLNVNVGASPKPYHDKPLSPHDQVRMEALRMLQKAGEDEKDLQVTYSVKKTKTGGYSSTRKTLESESNDADLLGKKSMDPKNEDSDEDEDELMDATNDLPPQNPFAKARTVKDSNAMEDVNISSEHEAFRDEPPDDEINHSSSWGSRYSVDRHLMSINGGKSSKQVLDQMDIESNRTLSKSKRNMFKSSPHNNDPNNALLKGSSQRTSHKPDQRTWSEYLQDNNPTQKLNDWLMDFQARREERKKELEKMQRLEAIPTTEYEASYSPRGDTSFIKPKQSIFQKLKDKFNTFGTSSNSSKMDAWKNVNLVGQSRNLPPALFSPDHDISEEKRLKRRRKFFVVVLLMLFILSIIGIIYGLVPTHKNIGGDSGTKEATYSEVGDELSFYVMSDTPHSQHDMDLLEKQLVSFDTNSATFVVHLGDVGLARVTQCVRQEYIDASELFAKSNLPMFIIPGNNDWNDCPNPESSWYFWRYYFARFDENNFDLPMDFPEVYRQVTRDENFAFIHHGVLFIGIHLVDGNVQSESEWLIRIQENVAWTQENLHSRADEYRSVVILGHAPPNSKVFDYFFPVIDDLHDLTQGEFGNADTKWKKPVLYLHANKGGMERVVYRPYPDRAPAFEAVELPMGGVADPTRVTVKFGPHPFSFEGGFV